MLKDSKIAIASNISMLVKAQNSAVLVRQFWYHPSGTITLHPLGALERADTEKRISQIFYGGQKFERAATEKQSGSGATHQAQLNPLGTTERGDTKK